MYQKNKVIAMERTTVANETLWTAFRTGNEPLFAEALSDGADINFVKNGILPIGYAIEKGQFDIARALIKAGAETKYDPKHEKFYQKHRNNIAGIRNPKLYSKFAANFINSTKESFEEDAPLVFAANRGLYKEAKLLLESGYRVEDNVDFNLTPLMAATKKGDSKIIELLLSHGADANNSWANMPTYEAALLYGIQHSEKIALQLLSSIDKKEGLSDFGVLVKIATEKRYKPILKELHERHNLQMSNPEVDILQLPHFSVGKDVRNPLAYYAERSDLEMVQFLIDELDQDPNIRFISDSTKNIPIHLVIDYRDDSVTIQRNKQQIRKLLVKSK